jgi:DMSO reductase anchor subunit
MHPAFSILLFTTLSGTGQGLVVALALATMTGVSMDPTFTLQLLLAAQLLLIGGLVASFFHLGHKKRAWRAVLMWRTSWMSREVIVLPASIAINGLWLISLLLPVEPVWATVLPLLALVMTIALWYCTAMIYACLRFVQEWAHPLTIVNFILIGMSSGSVLACAMASSSGQQAFYQWLGPLALAVTLLGWASRAMSLRRNAHLKSLSSLQSATGIHADKLVQKSMGMSAGSFNTREFFHHASAAVLRHLRWFFQLALFALPVMLMLTTQGPDDSALWWLAVLLQTPGLLAERWLFFAHAKHPQNLYYQTVS